MPPLSGWLTQTSALTLWIALALRDSDGSVSKAAHLLGFKHHQSLSSLISGRHPELLTVRHPLRLAEKIFLGSPESNRSDKSNFDASQVRRQTAS
jgi:hypothetical protein